MGGKPRAPASADWHVYLVECADGSLYAGIAVDVERRIAEHDRGRGARYTRGRGPVRLIAQSPPLSRGEALRLEYRVKRRHAKEKAAAVLETSASGGAVSRPRR